MTTGRTEKSSRRNTVPNTKPWRACREREGSLSPSAAGITSRFSNPSSWSMRFAALSLRVGRHVFRGEILLNECGAHMDVELHQRLIANRGEGMHLARLDHEHIPSARLERHPIHRPAAAASLNELDLVVRVPVRPGA